MKAVALVRLGSLMLVAPVLGACAMVSPPPVVPETVAVMAASDHTAALTAPCANASDVYPWLLTDMWDDGVDGYMPEMRFNADGVVAYAYGGNAFENGRWVLKGTDFAIDMNDHHTDYAGVFDGTSGAGAIRNVDGDTGTWTLDRACEG